eukprot:jgi/Mesen1/5119/ME000255S04090
MNDLFTQSWAVQRPRVSPGHFVELEKDHDLEAADHESGPGHNMDEFEDAVASVTKDIEAAHGALARLRGLHEESMTVVKASAMQELRERMDGEIEAVARSAKKVKKKVEALDSDNEANRRHPGCERGSATDRRRTTISAGLGKKLRYLMAEFQAVQSQMSAEYRQSVERRVYMVTGQQADPADIEHIIETGQSELLLQMAVERQGYGQMEDFVAEIQERHDAARDLEQSLRSLYQLFLDMAVLVESQGEMLDVIELQVQNATEHVEQGNKVLVKARAAQRSTRRWSCVCLVILTFVVAIAIIVGLSMVLKH